MGEPIHLTGDLEDRHRVRTLVDQVMSRIVALAALSSHRVEACPTHWTVVLTRVGRTARSLAGLGAG